MKLVKNGQELDGDYDEMLNLSDHDEVQPDDVQEEIDLDDYDEMLEFLGPKRLEMLMTCQVTTLKSMKVCSSKIYVYRLLVKWMIAK